MKKFTIILFLLFSFLRVQSQTIDVLIKNGHVIDPKNKIDAIMDVAIIDNKITEVAPKISKQAKKTIDATGMYVVPGLIDIHGHHYFGTEQYKYLSDSYTALPPDGFTFRAGVTTVVDAGGAGWRNFQDFKDQAFANSKTRMFAFLNIVGAGMSGGAWEQNTADMDPKLAAMESWELNLPTI
jgi:dihydroorotase